MLTGGSKFSINKEAIEKHLREKGMAG